MTSITGEKMNRRRYTAAATPCALKLLESWERIYLYALRDDEMALNHQIAQHVRICNGATSAEQVNDTLNTILLNEGYAVALKRVRTAIEKVLRVAA
jgi:hypothetical protein